MIRATERKTGRLVALLAGVMLTLGGCAPSAKSGSTKKAKVKVEQTENVGGDSSNSKSTDRSSKQAPEEFLGNFLKALGEGKANADMLSASFKKKIARPFPNDEAQQKLGYNPRKIEEFLTKAGVGKFDPLDKAQAAEGPFFYGKVGSAAGKPEVCLIRLVADKGQAGWQVDWFHRSPATGPPIILNNPGPELIGAQLAAQAFLENLLGGDPLLADAVLAKPWKAREYVITSSDFDIGYNQKLILQRLAGWGKDMSEFTIDKREIVLGKPAMFEGKLIAADRKTEKSFMLKVNKDAGGEWVIEDVEVK